MLDNATVQLLARQLNQARKSRTPLRHLSKQHPGMTVEDGYAIQREWVRLELVLLCHKSSFALTLPQQGHWPRRAVSA